MLRITTLALALVAGCVSQSLQAQEPGSEAARKKAQALMKQNEMLKKQIEENKKRIAKLLGTSFNRLPGRLRHVAVNSDVFEKSGYLKVVGLEFKEGGDFRSGALVWKLKVTKNRVKAREIRRFLLARRYQIFAGKRSVKSLFFSYDEKVSSSDAVFGNDEVFYVWTYMNKENVDKLIDRKASRMVIE